MKWITKLSAISLRNYWAVSTTLSLSLMIPLPMCAASTPINFSIIYTNASGRLVYVSDPAGNRIPDFSHSGYKNSDLPLPNVSLLGLPTINLPDPNSTDPNCTYANAQTTDYTACIQDAINAVSAYSIGVGGFRGVVQLAAGNYTINTNLSIAASGVVLRGSGSDTNPAISTILNVLPNATGYVINAGGNNPTTVNWTPTNPPVTSNIIDSFVPAGATDFHVDPAGAYQPAVGDNIIIEYPFTDAWYAAVNYGGMPLPTDPSTDPQWSNTTLPYPYIKFNRVVTGVNNGNVSINSPIYNSLDLSLSQAFVFKFVAANEGYTNNIGIENMRVNIQLAGGASSASGINFNEVQDAWTNNVIVTGYQTSGISTASANRITFLNTQVLTPSSVALGLGYGFSIARNSNDILCDTCYASSAQISYMGNSFSSGIAVVDSTAYQEAGPSEGHQKWSQGMLFDRLAISYNAAAGTINNAAGFYNRGNYGTSHGWSAVNSVLWGVNASSISSLGVQQPPTAQNYCMDCCAGYLTGIGLPGNSSVTGAPLLFAGIPGYFEQPNNQSMRASLSSLFRTQLAERLTTGGNPPTVPGKLTAVYTANVGVQLKWENLTLDANDYVVERSTNGGTTYTTLATLNGSGANSYTDASGTSSYYYRVYTQKTVGSTLANSAYSNPASPSLVVQPVASVISARYVKVQIVTAYASPAQINELQVFPNANRTTNIAQGKATTASSYTSTKTQAKYAVDGTANTYWAATVNATTSPWIYVDLGSLTPLYKIVIQATNNYIGNYPIQFNVYISPDAVNWTQLYGTTNGTSSWFAFNITY